MLIIIISYQQHIMYSFFQFSYIFPVTDISGLLLQLEVLKNNAQLMYLIVLINKKKKKPNQSKPKLYGNHSK